MKNHRGDFYGNYNCVWEPNNTDGLAWLPKRLRLFLHEWFDVHGPVLHLPLEPHPNELPRGRCLTCGTERYLDTDCHLFV